MQPGASINNGDYMKFDKPEVHVTSAQLSAIESNLSLNLPKKLKEQYLLSNGGNPDPYVYEDENVDTVVTRFLSITSSQKKRTAIDTYNHLVLTKKIVPPNYFPFAVDGGGDYFFVDCFSESGQVYFYRGDVTDDEEHLIPLGVDVGSFWSRLKPE